MGQHQVLADPSEQDHRPSRAQGVAVAPTTATTSPGACSARTRPSAATEQTLVVHHEQPAAAAPAPLGP